MKVALIHDLTYNLGGIWNYFLNVVSILNNSDIDITIIREKKLKDTDKLIEELDPSIKIKLVDLYGNNKISHLIWSNNYKKYKYILKARDLTYKIINFEKKEIERLSNIFKNYDVIHYPHQILHPFYFKIGKPIVINPHDFQHEHFPEFFSKEIRIKRREQIYPVLRKAQAIITHSEKIKDDTIIYAKVKPDNVFVAPYGIFKYEKINNSTININFDLPDKFLFYPARSWWHKNHLRLIEAIAYLNKQNIRVPLVITDVSGEVGEEIRYKISLFNLKNLIFITNRVNLATIHFLYRKAYAIIIPSLYEQQSGPILEALYFNKSILASQHVADNDSLVKDVGYLFDPFSVRDIASKILLLWKNQNEKRIFEENSKKKSDSLNWDKFISVHKEVYYYAKEALD